MDPRMRPLSMEILIAVGLLVALFQLNQQKLSPIDITDMSNPVTVIILLIFVAEFFRILYKLRKLRLEGVDLSNESLKSPVWYGASLQAGGLDYKINKILQPIYWAIAITFLVAGAVGIVAAIMISISR